MICGGVLLIAEEVATATSDVPWTSEDLELAKEVVWANRDIHDLENQRSVKSETESKGKKIEPFINQCFGHDQSAIEGFKDCENKLQQALDHERAERNAATEFEGAVKTEKVTDAQKSDDNDGDRLEEKINLDSQEADNEGEDHFCRPEFSEMDAELRERAKKVYQKLKATIKVIPLSFPERGEVVVETAVNNDVRPDSHFAAYDTTGIYKDKKGVDYGVKGAGSSIQLIRAVGAPLEAIGMNLPEDYPKGGKYKWMVVDDCWELPNASVACGPLNKDLVNKSKGKSKIGSWEAGSRILNTAFRHGNNLNITYQRGGWVDCASALAAVRDGLSKKCDFKDVVRIATVHWLSGTMFDKDATLIPWSRSAMSGARAATVREWPGSSLTIRSTPKLFPITWGISRAFVTRLGLRTSRISSRWASFLGGLGVTTTALTSTSRPCLCLSIGILLREGLRESTT